MKSLGSESKNKDVVELSLSSYKTPIGSGRRKGSFKAVDASVSSERIRKKTVSKKSSPSPSPSRSPSRESSSVSETSSPQRNGLRRFLKFPSLVIQTIICCVLAIILAIVFKQVPFLMKFAIELFSFPGKLFIQSLKLLVTPMIFFSMILVPVRLGDIAKAKLIGKKVIIFYLMTTFFAAFEGLAVYYIFRPGEGGKSCGTAKEIDSSLAKDSGMLSSILNIFYTSFNENIVDSFLTGKLLALIVFGLWFGFVLSRYLETDGGKIVMNGFDTVNEALFDMIRLVIDFTPVGILSLILTQLVSVENLVCVLKMMAYFILTVFFGNCFHWLVVYPLIYFVWVRGNAYKYYIKISQAMMTAFGAASSAAALPVTMKVNIENCNVSEETALFVLPLGATINMDGTAIYYPIAIIFLANITGQSLGFGNKIVVAIVSTFVSMGAAPIPSAGLIYLLAIINAVGLKYHPAISYILAIDWLMDRIQVVVNISGDSLAASIIDKNLKKAELKKKEESF